jgi:single-strand DNA-binding protein
VTELRLPELNRVVLSGRLSADPDRRYAADGTPVTTLALAFHRRYRGKDGQLAEHTGYATVVTYQRLAEVCSQYLHKGSPVLVEGRLQMREWTGSRGDKRTRLEIRGESVHFLEKAGSAQAELQTPDEGGTLEPPDSGR